MPLEDIDIDTWGQMEFLSVLYVDEGADSA